jgi:hypothetical protein
VPLRLSTFVTTQNVDAMPSKVLCKFAENFTVSSSPRFYVRPRVGAHNQGACFTGDEHEYIEQHENFVA